MFRIRPYFQVTTLVVIAFLCSIKLHSQLVIDNAVNAPDGVQNVLLGPGVTASGITFQGTNEQVGSFTCTNCGTGIGYGLILGTGNVNGASGPNNSGSYSLGPPDQIDNVSDPDLAELSGMLLNNTAVLSFDFVPTGDSLFFNYVFGSEEYPEFVNSINDAFGFFLSGPGITGPYLNNAANIALVPGTTTPISINTVNPNLNSSYYVSNTGSLANVQADGFTTVMTAIAAVTCGETYHIKIAIGDASDQIYDSWVMLEAGSFQSNQLSLAYLPPNLSVPGDGGMYEGCEPANLTFTRTGAADVEVTYDVTFSGTAQVGVDVGLIPSQIVFPINQTSVTIPVQAVQDGILEGLETLTVTLSGVDCSNASTALDINIYDLPVLNVTLADLAINCGQIAEFTPTVSGGLGNYHIVWENGNVGPTLSVYPTTAQSYNYTITDTCGVAPFNGSANVSFIVNPPIVVNIGPDVSATCLDQIDFSSDVSGGYGDYSYSWLVNGAPFSNADSISFIGNQNTEIILIVTDECDVTSSDNANVDYPANPLNVDLGSDFSTTCIDENVLYSIVSGGVGEYSYSWTSPQANLGNADSIVVQLNQNTAITLSVSDECGNSDNDIINISLPAVPIDVNLGSDQTVTCLDELNLQATINGGIGTLTYNWTGPTGVLGNSSSISYQTGANATIGLTVTDQCGNTDNDALNIIVPAVPVSVQLGNDLSVTCLDITSLNADVSGGIGNYTYSWSDQGGLLGNSDQLNYQTEQNSSVILQVTDECGNTGSDAIAFSLAQYSVIVDLGSDLTVTCLDEVVLNPGVTGGIGNFNYAWQINNVNSGNQTQLSSQFDTNSTVELMVTDQCGNSNSDLIQVNVPPVPVSVNGGEDVVAACIDVLHFNATASGGIGNYSFQWSDANGLVSANADMNYVANASASISVDVQDQCGNSASDVVSILIPPVPIITEVSNDTLVCINEGVFLSGQAIGGVGNLTLHWTNPQEESTSIFVAPEQTSVYTFSAQDACGNTSSSDVTVAVTDVHPNFTASYVDDFTVQVTDLTTDASMVVWEFSDGYVTSEPNPMHTFNSVEDWYVIMNAYSGTCRKSIRQDYFPTGALFVPNCFTPDNDGVNDVLWIKGHDIASFEMWIFNRNGEEIFHWNDIEKPWDGSHKMGKYYVPDGAYNYHIIAMDTRENMIEKEGSILILR